MAKKKGKRKKKKKEWSVLCTLSLKTVRLTNSQKLCEIRICAGGLQSNCPWGGKKRKEKKSTFLNTNHSPGLNLYFWS